MHAQCGDIKDECLIEEGNAKKNCLLPSFNKHKTYPVLLINNNPNHDAEFDGNAFIVTFDGNVIVGDHAYDNRNKFKVAAVDELFNSKNRENLLIERLASMKLLKYMDYDEHVKRREWESLFEI